MTTNNTQSQNKSTVDFGYHPEIHDGYKFYSDITPPINLEERLINIKQAQNPFLEAANVLLRAIADIPKSLNIVNKDTVSSFETSNRIQSSSGNMQESYAHSGQDRWRANHVIHISRQGQGAKEGVKFEREEGANEAVDVLHELLVQEIQYFTRLCEQANLRRDHMLVVRYALCTALDEAAGLTSWGGGDGLSEYAGCWSTRTLLQIFHQEGYGGNTVFLLLGRLAANLEEHLDVLEVMLHILGLGFQGHYRTAPDGPRTLETIRQRLFSMVSGAREPVPRELSPHWHGECGRFKSMFSVPVWVSASVLGLLVFALFSWYKYDLALYANKLTKQIAEISQLQLPASSVTNSKFPLKTKLWRLKELLASEISAGQISVSETELESRVIFLCDEMFAPGKATVSQAILPVLQKVTEGIDSVSGSVTIIGHTDNQPIRRKEFNDSNQVLSERRAEAVGGALVTSGLDKNRVTVIGRGDTQPLTGNETSSGRARNRRVELIVQDILYP